MIEKDFIDAKTMPESYDETLLTLVARDPYIIYAYWNISNNNIEKFINKIGGGYDLASFVLRMYDVSLMNFNGKNANHYFDIDINLDAKNWYINLESDNVTYCAEMGIKTLNGEFTPIIRSNFVTTPRNFFSSNTDLTWMEVKGNTKDKTLIVKESPVKTTKNMFFNKKSELGYSSKKYKKRIPLSREEIRAYYANLFPVFKGIHKFENKIQTNTQTFSKRDFKDSISLDLSLSEFYKNIMLGASAEMMGQDKGGASEQNFSINDKGASEQSLKEKKFFFEIGTELIVYGRTEPDAEVTLGNRKIELREDGTFTLRFTLPEGKIPLDFIAKSSNGIDARSISTSVERSKTKYK